MEPLPPELMNLEQQLRAFVPQAPQTSPEQLLYQAGWEAALAQHSATATATPAALLTKSYPVRANHYWAAACAMLLLLSTALGWRVWQQPQPGSITTKATTVSPPPQPSANPATGLAVATPVAEPAETRPLEGETSNLANYLELRQRVTRGGLSMWPVSTPVLANPNDAVPATARDWQAELLREAL